MTNQEFHSQKNINLRKAIQCIESLCGLIQLTAYGLAPNPWGFTYEKLGTVSHEREKALNDLLESLNSEQEKVIKELYL